MITRKDVEYIAHLSRIHLSQAEAQKLTADLEGILAYIEKLNTLDVANVKPTSHVLALKNVFRPDIVKPSLPQEDVTGMTTETQDGAFKVPQVIE